MIDDANNATASEISLANDEIFLLNLTLAVSDHIFSGFP
jgi:hypothetical protein